MSAIEDRTTLLGLLSLRVKLLRLAGELADEGNPPEDLLVRRWACWVHEEIVALEEEGRG